MRRLNRVMTAALCGVMAAAMTAPAAYAQDAQDGEDDSLYGDDEIVVTAQRQAQSLQEVPIAVLWRHA